MQQELIEISEQDVNNIKNGVKKYEEYCTKRQGYTIDEIVDAWLNPILPTYWDVFHTRNTNSRRECKLLKRGKDDSLLPSYDIGIFLVGYSSLPIALSLAEIQPCEKIYFLYSSDTIDMLGEICDRLEVMLKNKPEFAHFIKLVKESASTQIPVDPTPDDKELIRMIQLFQKKPSGFSLQIGDPSDPIATFKRIKEIIDQIDQADDKRIALDLTGGKKTMLGGGYTAGAIWASKWSHICKKLVPFCHMYYIDSKKYDPLRGGPDPGTEFLSRLDNPYDVYNVQSNLEAHKLFEKHNYEAAADLWEGVKKSLGDHATLYTLEVELKAVQSNLAMANCYKLWDDFAYEEAKDYRDFSFSKPERTGFWGYQEKHTHCSIDALDILSEVKNRASLFEKDKEYRIIHYAVDRYQSAVRRKKSSKLYDAIVRFSQVVEMLCNHKIRLIVWNNNLFYQTGDQVTNVPNKLDCTPLLKFLFGNERTKYHRRYEIRGSNERLNIDDYSYNIDRIVKLIGVRNDFIHFVEVHGIEEARNVANELQKLAREFIDKLSNNYISAQGIDLDTLLELHAFRQTSLSPAKQFVEELKSLGNKPNDEGYAIQIYNEKLHTFDGETQQAIGKALKDYWRGIGKWEGSSLSDKQREKVQTLQSILECSNE